MSGAGPRPAALLLALLLIASAVIAGFAARSAGRRIAAALARDSLPAVVPLVSAADQPIAAEADLFRATPGMLSIGPAAPRERSAHPRSLIAFRYLRAYSGAPPRIPHGVTAEELRTGACNECHERGGYSLRFSAYVPVTPHPEKAMCLQCHVGDDEALGFLMPGSDPNTRCPLCHGPAGGPPEAARAVTWPTAVWPVLARRARDRAPMPIPHDLDFREGCVACHAGPAAVAEIRTAHPERTACRQCHVAVDPGGTPFSRPGPDVALATGGAR
jgi:cytochrome c-type protein NapB